MKFIEELRRRARQLEQHIVLVESKDPRVLKAASYLAAENICRVTLLGSEQDVREAADSHSIDLQGDLAFSDPETDPSVERYGTMVHEQQQKRGKESELDETINRLKNPLYFGAAMVKSGEADGCVAGAVATTGEVIRAALQVIGLRNDASIVSSIFMMVLPDGKVLTYGDCGVVPYPDAGQLADIAIESSRTHRLLTQQEPVTAMLSFSTKGSARHEKVELVQEALNIVRGRAPKLKIDGEFQFDAAFVPEVARRKAPESDVAGRANVFIFPNLDAGNIAYKITERLGGASATGPILQGLDQPMMDLSRGCGWDDIVNAACVAILMTERSED
ncbi:MAG: phosphate acetyltransferase [Balneolaceae bacterium]|nr:phosphate acetyltransferase [Balneolaceae bacterium]